MLCCASCEMLQNYLDASNAIEVHVPGSVFVSAAFYQIQAVIIKSDQLRSKKGYNEFVIIYQNLLLFRSI